MRLAVGAFARAGRLLGRSQLVLAACFYYFIYLKIFIYCFIGVAM
jgi:hypothetical protein